ncbi:MAG: DUF721 domain-containing protein [Acidobacteriota bacterium]|nr:DUF721 domain-containing protein [Acidobacteriota bacterium]MDE3043635.1 DUF721 domain-containing protein [Acidobacteriota bacterium]
MAHARREPAPLNELLNTLAQRIKRVDLRLIDELRDRWQRDADPLLAQHCRPERIDRDVLVISVPSGAFAQRVREETPALLMIFSYLEERAPRSLRTELRSTKNPEI